jgi:hypothetical protein
VVGVQLNANMCCAKTCEVPLQLVQVRRMPIHLPLYSLSSPPSSPPQVVLNYDAPRNLETYLHRVGRTARAGSEGLAVSLVTDDDRGLLKSVVKTGRVTLKQRVVPHQVRVEDVGLTHVPIN